MTKTLALSLVLMLICAAPVSANYAAVVPNGPENRITVNGIPFSRGSLWTPAGEGAGGSIKLGGIKADHLFLLGCVNSVDEANPGWGGGDSFRCIFVGDEAGSIVINYPSGVSDRIPIVFGYTIWWRNPYNRSPAPYRTQDDARRMLDQALCVANGIIGEDKPYFLRIKLRPEPVESISFEDNAAKIGHPVVEAITLAGMDSYDQDKYKNLIKVDGAPVPTEFAKWLEEHTILSSDPYPGARREALKRLALSMYTYPEDLDAKVVRATKPAVTAKNFPGPKLSFSGPVTATILTNVLYENAFEMLARVDDDGMVHESRFKADNYGGFGGWTPELGPFYDAAYTRLRALTLLSDMGFTDKVEKAIDFFDRWLMYFPKAFPEIQLGGKPVPGHATVIANKPHVYFDELSKVGWPTKYETRDFGNPENDGHGLLMLTRWRAWLKAGSTKEWVDRRWEALNEAAEYIPWCLDNPDLSFSQHGLLYNESEGGLQRASIYCDTACYLGLLAYAEMAEASGRSLKAMRWREQARRLFTAMAAYYMKKDEKWGDVWDPEKSADFIHGHATLAPVILGMDLYGFDAINHLPPDWADRTRRTYAMQLTRNQPDWCSPAGLGYGQCYITQAALLLDEMADAEKMIDWMTRLCYAPRQPHPYRAPEGATVASDGSVWRRWGDLGNLYQMAEVVYTVHLMLGIDDLDARRLKLMPRLPSSWTGMQVKDWPVRVESHGKSRLVKLCLALKRHPSAKRLEMSIGADDSLDHCRVRLGPFPKDAGELAVTVNGAKVESVLIAAGDAKWAWVDLLGGGRSYRIAASVR